MLYWEGKQVSEETSEASIPSRRSFPNLWFSRRPNFEALQASRASTPPPVPCSFKQLSLVLGLALGRRDSVGLKRKSADPDFEFGSSSLNLTPARNEAYIPNIPNPGPLESGR